MSASPNFAFMRGHWTRWVALGFGTGLAPVAPGTAGTALGFLLFWLMAWAPLWAQLLCLAGLFALGVWVCQLTALALGGHDPGAIVWDETVAFALVLEVAPRTVAGFLGAFLLFRLFDIWKPFPVSWADRHVHGGMGIMLDDLLAAAYAMLVLWHLRGLVHA
ncbi:MAG: phosphatidylglycerophosphatase A [Betaproteobacteria bacterium]|nr:phosphatidylglycerophosphatase A [Betaproteobacteria bacterium]